MGLCKSFVEDGLFEGFEVGGLRELELAQSADFLRKCIELLHNRVASTP